MTARIRLSVALLVVSAAPVTADWTARPGSAEGDRGSAKDQAPEIPADFKVVVEPAAPVVVEAPAPSPLVTSAPCPPAPHLWVEAELLSWWIKNGPLASPLVTTGDPAAGVLAGTVGQTGTRVLIGGGDLQYGRTTGARLTIGGWAGPEPVGAEVSVLWLDAQDTTFASRSNAAGSPPLYIPVINLATGSEGQVIVADPAAGFAGDVTVHSRSRLWGAEANSLQALARGAVEFTLLCGLRYLDLKESLSIQNNATDLFLGTQAAMLDDFETANRFYGGQVGGRVTAAAGRWYVGLTYKLAVGCTNQVLDVTGVTVQSAVAPLPSGTFPGAIFTQPSNMGRHSSWEFSAVPEVNLRAGCQVMGGLRAFVGYDVIYWSRVLRPGLEIDRAVNPSQSVVLGSGTLTGSARPAVLNNPTDFFVQGITAGLEWRY